ncbi:MAG: YfiR family protein [Gammaproteobacteria bacterium]|nr:YfiR family protein [Gammaproteobacteria bacterium]
MKQIFKLAKQHHILTISELDDISDSDTIINFININSKLKFQISRQNALQSNLKISSRLLKLAQANSNKKKNHWQRIENAH